MDNKKIKEKIAALAHEPGVYVMKNTAGRIIYVGKAKDLKKRVASYFVKTPSSYKNASLVQRVSDVQTMTTPSEHQALLLEARLIKKHKPRYNVDLKDDKSFPFIKITKEAFPRVFVGRKRPGENVEYIGPYTNAKLLRSALQSIRRAFAYCTCKRFKKKTCLDYHLGLCAGPCDGSVSQSAYRKLIRDLKYFLHNGSKRFIVKLTHQMNTYSKKHKFEDALAVKERIRALETLFAQSKPSLAIALGLAKEPRRIEAFDISNLFGNEAVGSLVTFIDGKPSKDNYRRFRIRMVSGIDDYKMLQEVVRRRYQRVIAEGLSQPDLIIIDGGKGQLTAASIQLAALGLTIPIIAIAKKEELIYTLTEKMPLQLARDSAALQLVQRIRDEAHRFAVSYHHVLRRKNTFRKSKRGS